MFNNISFLNVLDFYFGDDENIYALDDTYTDNQRLELMIEFCIDLLQKILNLKVSKISIEFENGKRISTSCSF